MSVRVLVVEDEMLVRVLAAEALRDAGFEVLEAGDGERALGLCGTAAVDVLFTDIRLPGGISGWDIAERCREKNPRMRVIYASAISGLPPRPVPDSTWFQKPFTGDQVVTAVCTAIEHEPAHSAR
jgi:CheY-like chemotaxis protein